MNPETPGAEPDNLIDLINKLAPPPAPDPVSMVPQTFGWVVLGLIALSFGLVEHLFEPVQIEHSICQHRGLNKSDPPMQLRRRPAFCMFFNLVAHPEKVFRMKCFR